DAMAWWHRDKGPDHRRQSKVAARFALDLPNAKIRLRYGASRDRSAPHNAVPARRWAADPTPAHGLQEQVRPASERPVDSRRATPAAPKFDACRQTIRSNGKVSCWRSRGRLRRRAYARQHGKTIR